MPKIKTKSSTKKRFRFTATGLIKAGVAYKRHNMRKRPRRMIRQARGTMILDPSDAKIVLQFMPNR
ncbi:MAG: 50S ribosomal protein L35 [Holosporales bacterium]|jgi:large subunit ribosomal protein L35|nr:50S ribosomal protein L35 [Holosporales bacterium]